MSNNECDHSAPGILLTRVIWMRGTVYVICRRCGNDIRQRTDEAALEKMN